MVLLNGTLTPSVTSRIFIAQDLLASIDSIADQGHYDTAERLLTELAIYLITSDKKCVAKGL